MVHIILAATPGSGSNVVIDKLINLGYTRLDVIFRDLSAPSGDVVIDEVEDDYSMLTEEDPSTFEYFPSLAGAITHASLGNGNGSAWKKKTKSVWNPVPEKERITAAEFASTSPPKEESPSSSSPISGFLTKRKTPSPSSTSLNNFILRTEAGTTATSAINSVTLEELDRRLIDKWDKSLVVVGLYRWDHIQEVLRRPQSILLGVDAPFQHRKANFQMKEYNCMAVDSDMSYIWQGKKNVGLNTTLRHAAEVIDVLSPNAPPVSEQFRYFQKNHSATRPSVNDFFMKMADVSSKRSNCMKRRVGAVVVKNGRILSTGYNGTPTGHVNCDQGGCERCNQGASSGTNLDGCVCLHAEANALAFAGMKHSVGSSIYCTTSPCMRCAVMICQYGVSSVFYDELYSDAQSVVSFLLSHKISVKRIESH